MKNKREGIMDAVMAYSLWGVLPIYWKFLEHVPAGVVLAQRVFWSFLFMLFLLWIGKRFTLCISSFKQAMTHPKVLFTLMAVAILISINWFIFIWGISAEKIVETSLGYYMNPLISIMLGVVVLKERLMRSHLIAFFLALGGVLFLTVSYGQFPWISFALAVSFGLYGLFKKKLPFDSTVGMTLETLAVLPLAVIYLIAFHFKGDGGIFSGNGTTNILLIASGVATAVPLLLFAKGVQKVPLYLMGFLQYIAPTIMLILGVFLYHEPFERTQLVSFSCIWGALLLVSLSTIHWSGMNRKHRDKIA